MSIAHTITELAQDALDKMKGGYDFEGQLNLLQDQITEIQPVMVLGEQPGWKVLIEKLREFRALQARECEPLHWDPDRNGRQLQYRQATMDVLDWFDNWMKGIQERHEKTSEMLNLHNKHRDQ